MKGVGWEVSKSLDVQQAKKAGELISEVGSKSPKTQRCRPATGEMDHSSMLVLNEGKNVTAVAHIWVYR